MNTQIQRGGIYYAELTDAVGSEQRGYRPVLCLQNEKGNQFSPTIIVAAITGKVEKKPLQPTHYHLSAEYGLTRNSIVMLEQLRTIDKSRLCRYIGRLDEKTMRGIDNALLISIGLKAE